MILVFDMAAVSEMGEIDDVHSKDEGGTVLNGDIGDIDDNHSESSQDTKTITIDKNKNDYQKSNEPMDVDNEDDSEISESNIDKKISEEEDDDVDEEEEEEAEEEEAKNDKNNCSNNKTNKQNDINDKDEVVHEIIDDDEDEECEDEDEDEDEDDGDEHNEGDDEREDETIRNNLNNGINKSGADEPIELNDSGGDDGDVMIIEDTNISKENGASSVNNKKRHHSDELEVIELDSTPVKKKIDIKQLPTRRSIRNINKQKSYVETERDTSTPQTSEESDIEEVLPQDPLAVGNEKIEVSRRNNKNSNNSTTNSSTIVVKDTKRLVEIAAKSNNSHSGNKKEPTLVIIDTNSILSGRGPVPVSKNLSSSSSTSTSLSSSQHQTQSYPAILPMALPAQGMYPPNMRATITPITMNTSSTSSSAPSISISSTSIKQQTPVNTTLASSLAPLLPTLTDDMFVVEAPSFIVPYVYEKPPVADFKEFLKEFKNNLKTDDEQNDDKDTKNDDDKNDNKTTKSVSDDDEFKILDDDSDDKKPYSYFESPLGKFFIDIGFNLVQEFVQSDLLKQQKRKRDREGGNNPTTNKTINSLMKNLEFSKEHNESFKIPMKKCEFCHFKTESFLAMAHHLETPHTKNYVYKCNFCTYEVRNPHDILFHMEAEHMIRGRLERAPAFHQCPNCPFEDNQKGKLSRHLATCMKKFKPEKNLEPPLEWEPPAKIPRVPKQRQGLNVSAYQAMKTSQLQFLSKMQLLNSQNTQHPLHRGRGRPSLGTNIKGPQQSSQQQQQQQQQQQLMRPSNMVYKQQTMSGGSVLVPTNYQLSGNQVFQVVGGQDLGGRLGHPGHMAFVPNIPSASSTVSIQQQNQSKNKSMHQPSISITPLPRASTTPNPNMTSKPGDTSSKNSFVICEICDGYIKDLEQLRNHMQWIHKVKIHPKMIYNRPPLNCQKCQFRFFTDQGLERHLLGSHGLVTSSMQDAANKSKDAGRCPVCGRVYQWKLLNHVARDHNMTLKPAHLSYKCTVCTATFGMYKQFENHVYSAHSVVARRVMDKKNSSSSSSTSNNNSKNDQLMKPLKINDEITIIPQPAKSITSAGTSKESNPTTSATGSTNCRNNNPSTSKNADSTSKLNISTSSSNSNKITD